MAKFSELTTGRWIKAVDVGPRGMKGIIEEITEEEVFQNGKKEIKQCIWMRGQPKGFLLNKTNLTELGKLLPDDTDDCPGKPIVLKIAKVKNPNGGMVDGIQIDVEAMTLAMSQSPQPSRKPAPPVTQQEADQDIPF